MVHDAHKRTLYVGDAYPEEVQLAKVRREDRARERGWGKAVQVGVLCEGVYFPARCLACLGF
jgi:hypothetical protein